MELAEVQFLFQPLRLEVTGLVLYSLHSATLFFSVEEISTTEPPNHLVGNIKLSSYIRLYLKAFSSALALEQYSSPRRFKEDIITPVPYNRIITV